MSVLSDDDMLRIRDVVRVELEAAARRGELLQANERVLLREWIEHLQQRKRFVLAITQTLVGAVLVSAVLGFLAWVGSNFIDDING